MPLTFEDWMSDADAVMWHIERDPVLRSTITSVWLLDQAPDPERFDASFSRALEAIPRLRQRVVADPLGVSTRDGADGRRRAGAPHTVAAVRRPGGDRDRAARGGDYGCGARS